MSGAHYSVTDIGLPDEQLRDSVRSTNNFAASIIKTFKYCNPTFGMRKNRRVDTLVIIIADIFFPYHQVWKDDRIRPAKEYIAAAHVGCDFWYMGLIEASKSSMGYGMNDVNSSKQRYKFTWPSSPGCAGTTFHQTVKMCRHLWAAKRLHHNGPFMLWAEATNKRISDSALRVEDLQTGDEPNKDDTPVPVDDSVVKAVKT
ncbi:hypothetical protein FRC07_013447 [Ceratobasidium sp. 392]|nr:hypothetical protein FRC07_013447 [Ceratobasidium sp. 392]